MDKDLLYAIEEERVKMDRARMEIEKLSISTEESNVSERAHLNREKHAFEEKKREFRRRRSLEEEEEKKQFENEKREFRLRLEEKVRKNQILLEEETRRRSSIYVRN